MTTQTPTHVPISALRIDEKANVRHVGRGVTADFLASIKARGIQLPLIVRPNGKGYVVTDGGKRLAAAQELVKDGEWAADAPIPVIVTDATDAEARETSLTLNVVRTAMHPVDEYRAFSALHTNKEQPLDVDAIAERFGVARKLIEQRLALGALDGKILDAWRDGILSADAAQAFTLADKKAQVRIFDKLSKGGRISAWNVKSELKVGHENVGRYLNLIGVEAYEKRGGKVTRDLFGSDHVVSDPKLVKAMVEEKVEETTKALLADGWAWVEIERNVQNSYSYGTLQVEGKPTKEQKARTKELESIMRAADDDEDRKAAQAADAELDAIEAAIKLAAFTPAHKAKSGCFLGMSQDGELEITYGKVKPEDKKKAAALNSAQGRADKSIAKAKATKNTKLSQALERRVIEQREKAIKAALVTDSTRRGADALSILLARIVAGQIVPGQWNSAPHQVVQQFDAIANGITPKVMNAALRKEFDAEDYFKGAPKSFVIAAITEAVNADEARKVSNKKKSEIAKFAIANVTKTGWLPKELRTAHYDGPVKKTLRDTLAEAAKKTAKSKKRK